MTLKDGPKRCFSLRSQGQLIQISVGEKEPSSQEAMRALAREAFDTLDLL